MAADTDTDIDAAGNSGMHPSEADIDVLWILILLGIPEICLIAGFKVDF
jgi:hypothetical protein